MPYLQYCIIVWGKTNKTILTRLYKLQKKAIRIITFSDRLAHTDKLFEKMSIMKLGTIYNYFVSIFMYNYKNGQVLSHLSNMFIPNNFSHGYYTRFGSDYRVNMVKNKTSSFNVRSQGPHIWNQIPKYIRDLLTLNTFKTKIKQYMLHHQIDCN